MRFRAAKEENTSRPAIEMSGGLFTQLAYQYESDKLATTTTATSESGLDSSSFSSGSPILQSSMTFRSSSHTQQQHHQQQSQQQQQSRVNEMISEASSSSAFSLSPPERDYATQQRENKLQLQQHERDQHLHQLQSINNLLLELPAPTSPSTSPSSSYASSKYSNQEQQHQQQLPSPTVPPTVKSKPPKLEDILITDLLGLQLSRVPLINNQKEQAGQNNNYDSLAYQNYQQPRDNSSGYYSNLSSSEQYENTRNYYSNNMEVPSSPVSVNTPASPSSPGSLYSNPYSYSSVNSSQYMSDSSVAQNSNSSCGSKQFSTPSQGRYQSYGRPIRGCSTPYSSPTTEYPQIFNCNGSRSDSPADSDNSANSVDGPLSDIMAYLSMNQAAQRRYLPSHQALDYEAVLKQVFPNAQRYPQQQQQQQQQQQSHMQHHHYQQHAYGPSRNQNYNTQHLLSLPPAPQPPPRNSHPSYLNHGYAVGKNFNAAGPIRELSVYHSSNSAQPPTRLSLDKAAKSHRKAAANSNAKYTWSGTLPPKTAKPLAYSPKVFLGGVPYDITESNLHFTFRNFGQIKVEWPDKDNEPSEPKGYVYVIFESEKQVKALLASCIRDFSNGGNYFYKITSKRIKGKQVEVIPWALCDSNYVKSSSQKLDPEKTIFVGAVHGMMTAEALATVMDELFSNVIYAGIDTDKHKYPIGSARITFLTKQSYYKAINAEFIEVRTKKFSKVFQLDPYMEEAPCSSCYVQQGPYFCREPVCFKYYCHTCWQWIHSYESGLSWHEPMSRGLKNNQVIGLTPRGRPSLTCA